MEVKNIHLAIIAISIITLCCVAVSYSTGILPEGIVYTAIAGISGLAGYEIGREK